jgi:uncharacterized Zn-finger protein
LSRIRQDTKDMAYEPPETIKVYSNVVSCDGGEGPLGHPLVYLNLGDDGQVECPYCDRLFIRDQSDAAAA